MRDAYSFFGQHFSKPEGKFNSMTISKDRPASRFSIINTGILRLKVMDTPCVAFSALRT
ncbi:hypothetical protein MACH10_31160 [Thalassospira tepidiphila]|nr:hypothetical protein MACH10_31160 [Thalassospira tepidiphila]